MLPRPGSRDIDRRARLGAPPVESPTLPVQARAGNFDEVLLPWSEEMVRREAYRCLHCASPACVEACPLGIDIPLALWLAEQGDFRGAGRLFRERNNLSEICGRICCRVGHCEGACPHVEEGRPPVAIGRIETFLADRSRKESGWEAGRSLCSGHRVAVVGAGPAGLTVAELLAAEGHMVTVYDQWPGGGGMLRYGLPRFRLDHALVRERLGYLKRLGVEFIFNVRVGDESGVDDLLSRGFEAVFLGTGHGLPEPAGIPGTYLRGVHDGAAFLVQANVEQDLRPSALEDPPEVGRRVVVIGGGDSAMDCSRTAIRLGASEVTCYYRRSEDEAPGSPLDRAFAREEGVSLGWRVAPVRILGDGEKRVRGVELARTVPTGPGEASRYAAGILEGSVFMIPADTVVLALGCRPDPSLLEETPGLEADGTGRLKVDPATGRTTREGVWAGGGNVSGPGLLAGVVAQGRVAARDIHAWLSGGGSG
jgi:glutamate synthase (NADPH) small chain